MDVWTGFYKKTIAERQLQLTLAFPNLFQDSGRIHGLKEQVADSMIENCIGTIGLPLGLGLNFIINDVKLIIPMVIISVSSRRSRNHLSLRLYRVLQSSSAPMAVLKPSRLREASYMHKCNCWIWRMRRWRG